MRTMYRMLLLILISLLFNSCAHCPLSETEMEKAKAELMKFEPGVRLLAKQVLCNKPFLFKLGQTVKFEEFENLKTGNDLQFQPEIERIMLEEFGNKLKTALPESDLEPDFTMKGTFEYERDGNGNETNPLLRMYMIRGDERSIIFAGSVRLEEIEYNVSDNEKKIAKTGFEELDFEKGIKYIGKELLFQLRHDTYDPYTKTIYFAKVHNNEPRYMLKAKNQIVDLMLESFNGKFSLLPDEKDKNFSDVDYYLEAFLFHDKQEGSIQKVIPRFSVQVFDAKTGVRVAKTEAKFMRFDPEALDQDIEWLTSVETKKFPADEKKTEEMDIAFRLDTMAENAFSLKGIEGSEEEIIDIYKNIVNLIGNNDHFSGELEDAYANLFKYLYNTGKKDDAKKYLKDMLPLSIKNSKKINFSPRFEEGRPEFIKSEEDYYRFSLEVLSEYFVEEPLQVIIYGHTSVTDKHYINCHLSQKYGEYILSILKEYQPSITQKSRLFVFGRSFADCRICQGEDEYDRRVTFEFIGKLDEEIDPVFLLDCIEYGKLKGIDKNDMHPNGMTRSSRSSKRRHE